MPAGANSLGALSVKEITDSIAGGEGTAGVELDYYEAVGGTEISDSEMRDSKLINRKMGDDAGSDLARQTGSAATMEEKRRGSKAWLFSAYTFLILWGMAYLVLFFTDRLPI